MNRAIVLSSGTEVDFMVHGVFSFKIFGQTMWITTTHVGLLIIMLTLIIFAMVVGRKVRKMKPEDVPQGIVNVAELVTEKLEGFVMSTMGSSGTKFVNYISTIFVFILNKLLRLPCLLRFKALVLFIFSFYLYFLFFSMTYQAY